MKKSAQSVYTLFSTAIAVAILSFASSANAQDTEQEKGAGVHQKTTQGIRDKRRLDEALKRTPDTNIVIDSPQADIDLSKLSNKKILSLKKILFTPKSIILTDEEINNITKPYIGKKVSIRDLHAIRLLIDQLYDKKGYVARILLPNQEPKDGIIKMTLVEGVVGKFKIQSTKLQRKQQGYKSLQNIPDNKLLNTSKSYILNRLNIKEGDLLHLKRIENALIRFNMLNDAKLRLQLGQGAEQGQSDISLFVDEADPFEISYFFDNAGRESTGKYRHGITSTVRNLTGRGDTLFLNGIHTTGGGSTNVYVNYTLPLAENGLRLSLSYDQNKYEIIKGANVALDIEGKSETLTVGLSQPLILNRNEMFTFYTNTAFYGARSSSDNVDQTRNKFLTISPGFSYEIYSGKNTFITDHSFSFGVNNFGYDDAYSVYKNSLTFIHRPVRNWSFVARVVGQLTKEKLLPAHQQFIVGGVSSVRGYSEGILSGDDGYYIRLEIRNTVLNSTFGPVEHERRKNVEAFAFVDHGGAFPFKAGLESVDQNDFVTSVGIGTAFDILNLSTRITLAIPLTGTDEDLNYESAKIHFYTQLKF